MNANAHAHIQKTNFKSLRTTYKPEINGKNATNHWMFSILVSPGLQFYNWICFLFSVRQTITTSIVLSCCGHYFVWFIEFITNLTSINVYPFHMVRFIGCRRYIVLSSFEGNNYAKNAFSMILPNALSNELCWKLWRPHESIWTWTPCVKCCTVSHWFIRVFVCEKQIIYRRCGKLLENCTFPYTMHNCIRKRKHFITNPTINLLVVQLSR